MLAERIWQKRKYEMNLATTDRRLIQNCPGLVDGTGYSECY